MQLVRYEQLLPAFRIPGCPDSEIRTQLREAGYDFFRRSECWRYTLPGIDLVDGTATYTLAPEFQAQIRRIMEVRVNDTAGVAAGTKGTPQDLTRIEFTPPSTLKFLDVPTASVTDGLEVDVKLCPFRFSDEIPAYILDLHSDAIIEGTKYKLFDYPGNCPWADPRRAAEHRQMFEAAIHQATIDSDKMWRNVELVSASVDFLGATQEYYQR